MLLVAGDNAPPANVISYNRPSARAGGATVKKPFSYEKNPFRVGSDKNPFFNLYVLLRVENVLHFCDCQVMNTMNVLVRGAPSGWKVWKVLHIGDLGGLRPMNVLVRGAHKVEKVMNVLHI